jgi:hypothetical protein
MDESHWSPENKNEAILSKYPKFPVTRISSCSTGGKLLQSQGTSEPVKKIVIQLRRDAGS